jgi:hypothetical protein
MCLFVIKSIPSSVRTIRGLTSSFDTTLPYFIGAVLCGDSITGNGTEKDSPLLKYNTMPFCEVTAMTFW